MPARHRISSLQFGALVALATLVIWVATGFVFNPLLQRPKSTTSLTAIEKLGQTLFHDKTLSEPEGLSCAGCHDGRLQRQGNNHSGIAAVAQGSRPQIFGNRNTPSTLYAALTPPFSFQSVKGENGEVETVPVGGLFHDGRAMTLEEQAKGPLLNELEMNNHDAATFARKLSASSSRDEFVSVYGGILHDPGATLTRAAEAIAAYERTAEFLPFGSKFDKVLQGKSSFTPKEAAGFELFKDPVKGNCISCHVGDVNSKQPRDWLFTDFTYDVLAVPRNREVPFNTMSSHFDLGLCLQPRITLIAPKGVDVNKLCGAFKVPSLRNVAVTAPYFHNGTIKSLRDAVAFYATRETHPERWYGGAKSFDDLPQRYWSNVNRSEAPYGRGNGDAPRLNEQEIDAIVAFLETLTDPQGD